MKNKRRDFLKQSAAAIATMAVGSPISQLLSSCGVKNASNTTADSVIVLFMAGGMAHTETFDPKKYTHIAQVIDVDGFVDKNSVTH